MTRTDNKITLVNIKFNLNACKSLNNKELDALSDAATNSFHSAQAFGNKLELLDFVTKLMVEGRVQDLNSVTCGIFQIYFSCSFQTKTAKYKTKNDSKNDKK